MWVFFSAKRLVRCMKIQLRAPLALLRNFLSILLCNIRLQNQPGTNMCVNIFTIYFLTKTDLYVNIGIYLFYIF